MKFIHENLSRQHVTNKDIPRFVGSCQGIYWLIHFSIHPTIQTYHQPINYEPYGIDCLIRTYAFILWRLYLVNKNEN